MAIDQPSPDRPSENREPFIGVDSPELSGKPYLDLLRANTKKDVQKTIEARPPVIKTEPLTLNVGHIFGKIGFSDDPPPWQTKRGQ